jgi:hypothetical protein
MSKLSAMYSKVTAEEIDLLNNQVQENDMGNTWEKLSQVNVNENTEKKGKLTYLSWAWAWGMAKTLCPDANYRVVNFDGKPYHFDINLGYMVQTEVTIQGETIPMHLFVMDGANKAQKSTDYTYQTKYNGEKTCLAATMFDINTAIMRCLAKNIAMHGLGHYIYAGHDLPQFHVEQYTKTIEVIKDGITSGEMSAASEAWRELTPDEKTGLWVAKSKGGCFTAAERKIMQSTEFRTANGEVA